MKTVNTNAGSNLNGRKLESYVTILHSLVYILPCNMKIQLDT